VIFGGGGAVQGAEKMRALSTSDACMVGDRIQTCRPPSCSIGHAADCSDKITGLRRRYDRPAHIPAIVSGGLGVNRIGDEGGERGFIEKNTRRDAPGT